MQYTSDYSAAMTVGGPLRPVVAVAVVSWNTRELLARCLRSLEHDVDRGVAEVHVLDNASRDGSAAMVRAEFPWARLIESSENIGFGRAVNLIAEATDTPWLAISNADVALRPGALAQLIAAGKADPAAGIVAPRLILPDGSTQHSVFAFPTVPFTAVLNSGLFHLSRDWSDRLALRGFWNAERPRRVPWAVGAFLLARRSAWDAVGGFDPRQWMSAEDLDLGWRMHQAGWCTRYEPSAVVDHHHSAATGQVWGDELPIHWQRCAYAWMLRRRGRARTSAVGVMNFLGSGLRYFALWPLALVWPARFHEQWRRLGPWTLVHAYALAPRRTLERYI
jgi:GT2 family glycosyltransferase